MMHKPYIHDKRRIEDWEGLEMQKTLDFEGADEKAATDNSAAAPEKRNMDDNPLHKFRSFSGKQLMTPEHEAHMKEQTKKKRAATIQSNARKKLEKALEPIDIAAKATAAIAHIEDIERKIDDHVLSRNLYPEVQKIRNELAGLNVLVGEHRDMLQQPLNAPIYLGGEENGTVYDSFTGAFEFYREILAFMASGQTASGMDALDMHARDQKPLFGVTNYEIEERRAIMDEGKSSDPREAA